MHLKTKRSGYMAVVEDDLELDDSVTLATGPIPWTDVSFPPTPVRDDAVSARLGARDDAVPAHPGQDEQ